jgi:hypothetical protein
LQNKFVEYPLTNALGETLEQPAAVIRRGVANHAELFLFRIGRLKALKFLYILISFGQTPRGVTQQ